ncbi:MAG: MIP/aquaporin family protein [Pseudomonadota bacterium]|nr:MIP/aquaporin family protein [Pseudomonadota bacterium]
MTHFDLVRRLTSELVGTAFLLACVIGSGIMGENLSPNNDGIALLGNTIATGGILVVLILVFGPISGAHFNPAVTLSFLIQKQISVREAMYYWACQIAGGLLGMLAAHFMFELPLFQLSTNVRTGGSQWLAEAIATFGLVATIIGCLKSKPAAVPYAVGLYITAGYWFTASTSFANPAVTLARSFTNTFSGIAPINAPGFIIAQVIGAIAATYCFMWLLKDKGASD